MAERRGSVNCVVRLLWSTKYTLPVAVFRISQPGGKGPSSSQLILLRSLKCKFESKLDIINKCSTGFVQMYRYLLVLQCTHSYMHQARQVMKIPGKGSFDYKSWQMPECIELWGSSTPQTCCVHQTIPEPFWLCVTVHYPAKRDLLRIGLWCLLKIYSFSSLFKFNWQKCLLQHLVVIILYSSWPWWFWERWLSWMFFFQSLMLVQGLWCTRTSALTPVKVSFVSWNVM